MMPRAARRARVDGMDMLSLSSAPNMKDIGKALLERSIVLRSTVRCAW